MASLVIRPVGHVLATVVSNNDLSVVDGPTTVATANGLGQRNVVGTQVTDDAGNIYIYLPGVASVAQGDFVSYQLPNTPAGTATVVRAVTGGTAVGPIAMACGAIVANCWGWFQIYGMTAAVANIATAAFTNPLALYESATAGRLTTSSAGGTIVFGAFLGAAAVSNVGQALLNYPFYEGTATV